MLSQVFHGEAQGGKVRWRDSGKVKERMCELNGRPVVVTIEPARSLDQNAYFHGVVLPLISDYTGYEPRELKVLLKDLHNEGRPTSSLSTSEMAEFIDRVVRWAATDLNIVIPDPQ
jgi:PHP family Zn ribbon phosphoesterase